MINLPLSFDVLKKSPGKNVDLFLAPSPVTNEMLRDSRNAMDEEVSCVNAKLEIPCAI